MKQELKDTLTKIGFLCMEDSLRLCRLFVWGVGDYQANIEYAETTKDNENIEKVMEIIHDNFYGHVYRVVPVNLYIIYLSDLTYKDYFNITVYDKKPDAIATLQTSSGFIYIGNQSDAVEVLSSLTEKRTQEKLFFIDDL